MPQPAPVECPHCGNQTISGSEPVGQSIYCGQCGKAYVVGSKSSEAAKDLEADGQRRQSNPIADLSVLCGLIGCVPFFGLLAIILGIVGLRKTKNPSVRGKGVAIAGIVLGSVGLPISVEVAHVGVMLRQTALRISSASHLRQIGEAIVNYTNENRNEYPPDLGTLVKAQNVPLEDFLCPSMPGGSSLPSNVDQMTIEQKADWVNQHADVVYLGAGLRADAPADTIVLYEKRDERNSPPDGSYDEYEVQMLFADGHVEPVPTTEAHHEIDNQRPSTP